jgi:hypothetical protein
MLCVCVCVCVCERAIHASAHVLQMCSTCAAQRTFHMLSKWKDSRDGYKKPDNDGRRGYAHLNRIRSVVSIK